MATRIPNPQSLILLSKSRTARIVGSFTIVVIAYWAYAFLAVPWIEPPVDLRGASEITDRDRQAGEKFVDVRLAQLRGLFDPNSWQLQNPKILESNRAKLLFQTYHNYPDGRVELNPCTIVLGYDGPAKDEEQRRRQSIVLEAPDGAILQFNQPLDLNRGQIGRLVRGELRNLVRIRSDWKEPGPQDDLLIVTRDIQLTEQTIFTPNPVDFRWGPHFGRGQDMLIKLLSSPPQAGDESVGPNITGIDTFEMRHVERLHLDLAETTAAGSAKPASVPVEIHCSGPFRFDVVGRVATFRDRVDVMKANPAGPSDQITCDLLSLFFADRSGGKTDANSTGSLDLVAQRIEAQGNPAVVTAPSQQANGGTVVARGQRLAYDLQAGTIRLDGGQEAFLQQGGNELHARSLFYQSAGQGKLGRVDAQGPGWLRGRSPQRSDQQVEAVWKDKLKVEPDGQEHRITLTGGAELNFPGAGQLQAPEIKLWLIETPAVVAGQSSQLRPSRMSAGNDVHLNSPQLAARVQQLDVAFEGPAMGGANRQTVVQPTAMPAQTSEGSPAVGASQSAGPAAPPTPWAAPFRRFDVTGRLLQATIAMGPSQTAISRLSIEDGVEFVESQSAQPDQPPLRIRGDRLDAADPSAPSGTVTVTGRPASVEGRGLALNGATIKLDRGANLLAIDGPGNMQLTPSAPAGGQAQPVTPTGPVTVNWQGRMRFDGREAKFEEGVVASAPPQQLQTQTMIIQLQWPISFTKDNPQGTPQAEQIKCLGGVSMEQRAFDQRQQQVSYDRMEVTQLAVNLITGDLTAGPGWLSTVRHGGENPLDAAATPLGQNAPAAGPASQDQLKCLYVRFQRSITGHVPPGNAWRRQLTFDDHVKMTYATAPNWDTLYTTDNPDKLPTGGIVLSSDQLTVVQMLLPMSDRRSFELEALGNAVVEGAIFTARAARISYAEANDRLILEGDGRSNAEFVRQSQPGAPADTTAARQILYWRKTGQLKAVGIPVLQFSEPPSGNRRR